MSKNKTNKTIAITGGTRGIGYATAISLLKAGFQVGICYLNSHEAALEMVKQYPKQLYIFQGDIADPKTAEQFSQELSGHFGPIDVLINNAAISHYSLLTESFQHDLKRLFQVNVLGTLQITKAFIPQILKTKGLIINISSVWGHKGASCETPYSMTKGAINQLTSSLAKELGPNGVRTIGIAPGLIDTDMNIDLELESFIDEIPLKRPGQPEEVVQLIHYLIEKDTYLNGITIAIDGGYSI